MKPASYDCNLFCDYCFYRATVASYPDTGAHRLSMDTLTELVRKAQTVDTQAVSYVWQGGEPMLMGLDFYRRAVELQNVHKKPGQTVLNTVQTNGILIDEYWARFFAEHGILVGISIDGPKELHDRHRFTRSGASVFDRVLEACDIMNAHRVEYNVLTVVTSDTADHPEEIYTFLKERGFVYQQYIDCIEAADGLIAPFSVDPGTYGGFLCRLFDVWFMDGYPYVSIRLFDNLLQYYVRQVPECCLHKDNCGAYFVVEYNGDIYPCDFFVREEWLLGNIREMTVNDLIGHQRRLRFAGLRCLPCDTCEQCSWLGFCQKGCIRYRAFPDGDYRSLNYLCESYRTFFEYTRDRYPFLAWDIQRRRRGLPAPAVPGRNDPCFCDSGRKFKKCCEPYAFLLKK